jgi:hypothetical protein
MKNKKPNAELVWKQTEEDLVPRLGLTLIERRNVFELMRDQAADQFEHHTHSAWRPRNGSKVNHRNLTAALIDKLFDRAAVLFAFEQVGGAQAALDMAKAYALERYAFGRPIGSFQAIKHKLADVYVATELARSNAYYGAWALSQDAPELPVAAAAARVAASDAFNLAAKENIQTHGGMGYTWAFDCHLYYRRAKLLALALGSPGAWKDRLVTRLEAQNEGALDGATGIAP